MDVKLGLYIATLYAMHVMHERTSIATLSDEISRTPQVHM